MILLKSILHNIGVVFVGLLVGFGCAALDHLFGIDRLIFPGVFAAGVILIAIGFLIRVWATHGFYRHQMRVISLDPQQKLLTSGAYAYSRNPLYLGGNVFIFFGAALVFGSPAGLFLVAAHLPLVNQFIKREERQLAASFGDEWTRYAKHVRRWI